MTYKLYMPSARGARPSSLVVVLGGAGEGADTTASRSRWNLVAERLGFLVAYPQPTPNDDPPGEWDWAKSGAAGRGDRSATLIAGITRKVAAGASIAAHRVFVVGFSAGAGMASVMAATYPDLYRGLGLEAGCSFDNARCAGASVTNRQAAAATVAAMGRFRRPVAVFNEYGSIDPISLSVGSDQVVPTWLIVNDLLDDGADNASVGRRPAAAKTYIPDQPKKPYRVATYTDRRGCQLAQDWLVVAEQHAWAGGSEQDPADAGSDANAPDVTTAMYRFFTSDRTIGASARCP